MSASRLRVAIVAPSLRVPDGQSAQAARLLQAWVEDPVIQARLVPSNPLPPTPLHPALNVKYLRTVVVQATYWPLLFRELRHVDVVHVFSGAYTAFLLTTLPAVIVARALRKPVLVNYRSGEAPDHLARSVVARFVLAHTDLNVVPSNFLAGVFDQFNLNAHVIHNIVDRGIFRYRRRHPLRPHLLSTRSLEPLYNVACTLRAFRLVQDRYAEARLTIVGGGREEGSLRRLVSELGLQHVRFVGPVPPDEIARYYQETDIYVQTPNVDNMPASILEAYASGLPVVATDVGGVPSILTDGVHGLLAPVGNHEAVAGHVLRLLEDPDLAIRLSLAGLESCRAYSWPSVRAEWLAAYRAVVAKRETIRGRRARSRAHARPARGRSATNPAPAGGRALP